METTEHSVAPSTSQIPEDQAQSRQEVQPIFKIENITVIKPPLLKIFYWESLKIDQ